MHSGEERAISCCQPHRMPWLTRKISKGNRWEEIKGDGTRCVLRTSSPRVGFSPTPSPPQKNKHWKRRKESLKTVRWIRAPVDKVEDIRRRSTRRAKLAPGTPFSWAACDKTKVAALPRSRGQDDGSQRPEDLQESLGKSAMRGKFLSCCSL